MARKTPVIPVAFEIPSYSTLVANVGAYLDAELTAAGFSWSSSTKYSLPWVLARVTALVLGAVYRFQKYIASGILPSTSRDLEQLQLFGNERGIVYRSGTRATGLATVVNASGVDITLPAGSYITDTTAGPEGGQRYLTTVPKVIDSAIGFTDVPIQAEFIGASYLVAGHSGRLDNAPTGITSALLFTANAGGLEDEAIDEYRTRILDYIANPPEGGAVSDWQMWASDILSQNVDNVWIYAPGSVVPASFDVSGYVPAGTVGVLYSLDGSGTAKIPTAPNIAAMTVYLLAHPDRPVTSLPEAFAPVDNNVPMTLRIHAVSGAVAGAEITALEAAVRLALENMLINKLGGLPTPGATIGEVVKNSWIHDALAGVGGLEWWEITTLDSGSCSLGIYTTHSWELTRFTVTFAWE